MHNYILDELTLIFVVCHSMAQINPSSQLACMHSANNFSTQARSANENKIPMNQYINDISTELQ